MNKIKFPIIKKKGTPFYPTENKCPICGTDRTTLNSEFFVLNGGALKIIDKDHSTMSDDMEGFFSLTYHGGEKSGENGTSFDIVEFSRNGQFDIYFCSIECLQIFFNRIVDELKQKMEK
jgi:endogenous inhibitor of DNA gyrase (YacG/DUF329 family)